jgi:hypothetical protein
LSARTVLGDIAERIVPGEQPGPMNGINLTPTRLQNIAKKTEKLLGAMRASAIIGVAQILLREKRRLHLDAVGMSLVGFK